MTAGSFSIVRGSWASSSRRHHSPNPEMWVFPSSGLSPGIAGPAQALLTVLGEAGYGPTGQILAPGHPLAMCPSTLASLFLIWCLQSRYVQVAAL